MASPLHPGWGITEALTVTTLFHFFEFFATMKLCSYMWTDENVFISHYFQGCSHRLTVAGLKAGLGLAAVNFICEEHMNLLKLMAS